MTFKERIKNFFTPIDLRQGKEWKVLLKFSLPVIVSYLFTAGLYDKRRDNMRTDSFRGRGCGRKRRFVAHFRIFTVRFRLYGGLYRNYFRPNRQFRQRRYTPFFCRADNSLRGDYRSSDLRLYAQFKTAFEVDKRHARKRGGLHLGVHLLYDNLCRYFRADVL